MFDKKQKSANSYHYLGAIFMILLGAIYFLAVSGFASWHTVGMMLAIVPVMWVLHSGWRAYQAAGQLTGRLISNLMWGLFPFLSLGLWYVGFKIGNLWPLALVFVGVTMLINKRGG